MCCPFISNSTHQYICNSETDDDCVIDCSQVLCTQLLVYALPTTSSLTFICSQDDDDNDGTCNMVKIFGSIVPEINFNCTNCQNINVFAEYTSKLNIICYNCSDIFVDAYKAHSVEIDVKSFSNSIINAINTSSFTINCQAMDDDDFYSSCNSLKLYIPNNNNTTINCEEYSCSTDIEIYAYNGMLSLTNISLFTCGNCFSWNGCITNWEIFCDDTLEQHTTFYGGNCSDRNEYCNCQQFFDNGYDDQLIDGVEICANGYIDNEPIVPFTLGWIFAIILFIIIGIFLYGICHGYICQCIDKDFKEHQSVHPPIFINYYICIVLMHFYG